MNTQQARATGRSILVLLLAGIFMTAGAVPATAGPSAKAAVWQKGAMEKHRPHRPPLGIWRDPEMIRKLELTEAQINKLREVDFTSREKRLELKAQRDRLELQMEKAFSEDTVEQKTVLKLAEKISAVRGDLFLQRIESRLAVGKILSADQMKKLIQHRWQKKKCDSKTGSKSRARNHSA